MVTSGDRDIGGSHPSPAGAPEPGSFVGEYLVGRPIGDRGGMSTVFLAYEPGLDRAVALKRLDVYGGQGRTEALLQEARLTCSLAHPNVVTVHDFFVADGAPYMAMEYLPRGSLRQHVGRLSLPHWLRVLEALLTGLQYAHDRGVVHCDIKPANLLVDNAGSVKIADFGVARSGPAACGARPSEVTGTPLYMAPEQALGQACTPQTDLYATGLVAYELLLGRAPFPAMRTAVELLLMRAHGKPRPPLAVAPALEPELAGWLEWLLARAPGERPRSAREAWEHLEELAVDLLGPLWRRHADPARLALAEPTEPCADRLGPRDGDAHSAAAPPTLAPQPC